MWWASGADQVFEENELPELFEEDGPDDNCLQVVIKNVHKGDGWTVDLTYVEEPDFDDEAQDARRLLQLVAAVLSLLSGMSPLPQQKLRRLPQGAGAVLPGSMLMASSCRSFQPQRPRSRRAS